jgi:hypothetical protein
VHSLISTFFAILKINVKLERTLKDKQRIMLLLSERKDYVGNKKRCCSKLDEKTRLEYEILANCQSVIMRMACNLAFFLLFSIFYFIS